MVTRQRRIRIQPVFAILSCWVVCLSNGCISGDPNINVKTRLGFAQGHARRFLREATGDADNRPLHDHYRLCVSERSWFSPDDRKVHRFTIYDYLKCGEAPGPQRFVIAYDALTRSTSLRDDPRSNVDIQNWDEFRRRALYQTPGDYKDLISESQTRNSDCPSRDFGKTASRKSGPRSPAVTK
ncbi:MAG TPA: hypothetical protein P5081_22960 [Phycisphaerae bacterium]|nr:hypothetical protein [Phycisphaerae bacterium]HRW55743.1 hypothetical protein [Phycisphaerae bacterium]